MNDTKIKIQPLNILFVLIVTILCSCQGDRFGAREKGALGGGALGAGLGAIIGHRTGSPGAGIAIGGVAGALTGGLLGNEIDSTDAKLDRDQRRLEDQERELVENRRLIDDLRANGLDARETSRGVVVNLPDVLFNFDSARLTSDARRKIRDIADTLRRAPDRRIAVEGHTDSVGSYGYNQKLSEDRANSVKDELIDNNIPGRNMIVRGYGKSRPIASNSTDSGRQKNRRVEVILEKR